MIELQSKLSEAVPFRHTLAKVIQERDMLQQSLDASVNPQTISKQAAQMTGTEQ